MFPNLFYLQISALNNEDRASVHIDTFLGGMLVQHGKRSSVSFGTQVGTFHWRSISEYHDDESIEGLIENKPAFLH